VLSGWQEWLTGKRNLKIEKLATGEIFDDEANVLVSARGNLNEISWPDIQGLETFKGEIMHSAAWNEKCDLCLYEVMGGELMEADMILQINVSASLAAVQVPFRLSLVCSASRARS
jgi:hypothetical protein